MQRREGDGQGRREIVSAPAYLCGGAVRLHEWTRLEYVKLYAPSCDEYWCPRCGWMLLVRFDVATDAATQDRLDNQVNQETTPQEHPTSVGKAGERP